MIRSALLASLVLSAPAAAQSFNIDFGSPDTAPSPLYSAAGVAGFWNTFDNMPASQRFALRGLWGEQTGARVYNIGTTQMLAFNNPLTTGDDERLMDDMYLSFNNPIDACIFLEGLRNGAYQVLTYAMTPNDPARLCRVRVDFAASGPVLIGGAWPGAHQQGVTYARHSVNVTSGTIGLHSGLFNGNIQSGINGVQIIELNPPCAADVNGDGHIDPDDLSDFITCFFLDVMTPGTCIGSDFNHDGSRDPDDLADFITEFFTC